MNYHGAENDLRNDSTSEKSNISQQTIINESSDLPVDKIDSNVPPDIASHHSDRTSVTWLNLLFLLVSLAACLYDYIVDIFLAERYFSTPKTTIYCCITILLTVLPGLAITWLSNLMYRQDPGKVKTSNKRQEATKTILEKIAELEPRVSIVIFFKLALPIRICRSFCFALLVRKHKNEKDRDDRKYFSEKLNHEQQDVALLSIVRCFLEVAPQLILQLYISYTAEDKGITATMCWKILGCCVSLFILGWSPKSYHCNTRTAQLDKDIVKRTSQVPLFIWYFCTVGSRIILFTIAFVMSPLYTSLVILFICIGWTLWIYFKKDGVYDFCHDETLNPCSGSPMTELFAIFFVSSILSVVYLFIFVNVDETRTLYRYIVYYTLYTLEMATVIALWAKFHCLTIERDWYSKEFLILSVALYLIGIAAMVIYYRFFHPTVWSVKTKSTSNSLASSSQRSQL